MKIEKKYEIQIEKHYNYIISEWKKACKNNENYNCFDLSNVGKIKQLLFHSFELKASFDVFTKLKLDKYLGEEYTEKMFGLFIKRNDYNLFMFLFSETIYDSNIPPYLTLIDVKNRIDSALKLNKLLDNSIYQCFIFSNKMQEKFFAGDLYLGIENKDYEEKLVTAMEICLSNNKQDFFPTLQAEIHNLIGNENCVYDFHEIGNDGFCLFWSIEKSKYSEIMKKISSWAKYKELEDYMFFDIKDENNNILSSFGNKKVSNDYYN